MDKHAIIRKLPDGTCTRQQILHVARIIEPSFKETQLRYLMGTLHDSRLIVRVGRNQYKKVGKEPKKSIFTGVYSHAALQVIQYMQEQFPLLSYRVWELSWLNEFFNHQFAQGLPALICTYVSKVTMVNPCTAAAAISQGSAIDSSAHSRSAFSE